MAFEQHDFYCINCGHKGIPIQRKKGHQHKNLHMKKLFCIYCQQEVNHIECKTPADVKTFKSNFKKGVYKKDAEDSLTHVRSERSW